MHCLASSAGQQFATKASQHSFRTFLQGRWLVGVEAEVRVAHSVLDQPYIIPLPVGSPGWRPACLNILLLLLFLH